MEERYRDRRIPEEVKEMKYGKVPGLDEFLVECLKKGGTRYDTVKFFSESVKRLF